LEWWRAAPGCSSSTESHSEWMSLNKRFMLSEAHTRQRASRVGALQGTMPRLPRPVARAWSWSPAARSRRLWAAAASSAAAAGCGGSGGRAAAGCAPAAAAAAAGQWRTAAAAAATAGPRSPRPPRAPAPAAAADLAPPLAASGAPRESESRPPGPSGPSGRPEACPLLAATQRRILSTTVQADSSRAQCMGAPQSH